jgi:hypothetical protein
LDRNLHQIIDTLIVCIKNLGIKTSVYVLFVGILSEKNSNFARHLVDAVQNDFFVSVRKHDFHHARPLV